MDGRYATAPFLNLPRAGSAVSPGARIEDGAVLQGPCFVDEGVVIKAGARVGPYSVIGRDTHIDVGATVEQAILWPNCRIGREATVSHAILGRNCDIGRGVILDGTTVLGDNTTLTDYTRIIGQ
jgi:NDP-sugar pyrophosphorylase family protein